MSAGALKERLARLRAAGGMKKSAPPNEEDTSLKSNRGQDPLLSGDAAPDILSRSSPDAFGLRIVESSEGQFLVRERNYLLEHKHGRYAIGQMPAESAELGLFVNQPCIAADQLVFLDIESTGLGVGAGNVPFMIGIGFYSRGAFTVEQLFIRNPAEERAMLVYLQSRLKSDSLIVTYNGRSFDWPVIVNRYVLNRLPAPNGQFNHSRHIDLLYPSRNLWRKSLPSCRLAVVEQERIGFERFDDVPGALAPTLYFQYLAGEPLDSLHGVFIHNEHDILTLAALMIHFDQLLKGSEAIINSTPGHRSIMTEPIEQYYAGAWLYKMGQHIQAEMIFSQLRQLDIKFIYMIVTKLAAHYKKLGQYEECVPLWERAVKFYGKSHFAPIEPYVELAIYYEHKSKQFQAALACTESALGIIHTRLSVKSFEQHQHLLTKDALYKRQQRLRHKLHNPQTTSKSENQLTGEQHDDQMQRFID